MDATETAGTATSGITEMVKLSPNAAGLAVGILWCFCTFFCGITAIFGWGDAWVKVLASFYIGYAASFVGAIIGAIWAFADGYIAGAVVGWLYNRLTK
ncbi:MAG TPA: bacteriophage holin [Acidobacteriaceae bacterium]|nr:bacteriophage holin [Acidobacteriaceae bacterium]